ncbi:unnamed protein product [Spirodela intermedia]|uniref:Uncharacterized protein n=2 Tax=Spirodela intermedia TaxID=51605 RepID=A0A7I8IPK2_SPIIN|nr:unnamed protein product [Spirodela intermedia]CAA6659072.1 unnamed protein product [Spirodela intermedia]CAA7395364.1 unnamed protein product [Spirodela intermedia]
MFLVAWIISIIFTIIGPGGLACDAGSIVTTALVVLVALVVVVAAEVLPVVLATMAVAVVALALLWLVAAAMRLAAAHMGSLAAAAGSYGVYRLTRAPLYTTITGLYERFLLLPEFIFVRVLKRVGSFKPAQKG